MFVSTNPWKFGTEVVLCCIVFLLYSSWSLPFLTNRSNHKGCQASKPKAALRYLSHLLVWHVVVDVVAMMEAAVKASPENERRMKFGTREHKNCDNSGWVSCQPWESVVGDVRREVRSGYGFANHRVPTAFQFCRNQVSSRCGSLETPNFSEKPGYTVSNLFLLCWSIHEWNKTVAMVLYIGFICLLMLPEELNVFGRLRQVWWAEG